MTNIVLVPGAWLGAWAWDAVAERLRAAGHDPHPVTLTGLDQPSPEADLETHIDDVVRAADGLPGVVLVGHSYGGFPVTGAAERIADRLRRVVYVDAGPVPAGATMLTMVPPEEQQRLRDQVGDTGLLPPPPWDPAQDPNLAGVDEAGLALLRERATPHPFRSWIQPIRRAGRFPVPTALVSCIFTADQVQEMIAAGHPYFTELADAEIVDLATGHWPMLSEPERLAEILDRLAR